MALSLQDRSPKSSQSFILTNTTIVTGPFLPCYTDGAIAIENGLIVGVGLTKDITAKFSSFEQIDASEFTLMPGLFNSHTHVAMGFFRGLGHSKTNMIESFLFPAEAKLTLELLEPLSYSYIYDGLRAGVTSFVDHYYYSAGIGKAFERFGVRGWLGETIADLGGAFPGRASFERAKQLIESSVYSSRIRHTIAPHAADTISKTLLTEVSSYAHENKLPIHMHLAQTAAECERVHRREGISAVQFVDSCGALTDSSLVVHLTNATRDDLKIIASSKATIGWCPASTVIFDKLAPVKEFFLEDIPLALGTDCAASNDSADVLGEMRTGALFAKHTGVPENKLTPDHLLAMATTIPAKVLGVGHTLGTLEVGKFADIAILKNRLSSKPQVNILANIIYSMGARDVSHCLIDGQWRIWNSDLVNISETSLTAEYNEAVSEITKRVGLQT